MNLDLPDSFPNVEATTSVTTEQLSELRARVAHHLTNPDEPTFTLAEIKVKAGIE